MAKKGPNAAINKAQSAKISQLAHEGYPQKQSIAISYSERDKGGIARLKESHGGKNPKAGKK
jgi:hypothetical protein